jgi:hypothetical protein
MKKSRKIDARIQSTSKVQSAAVANRDILAEALAARAVEVQGPNTKATKEVFVTVLDFLADTLKYGATNLDVAELSLVAERADDVKVREERDGLSAQLVERMVRVRSTIQDALGAQALKLYGLEGETPRDTPREVASHAHNVVNLLKGKPFSVAADGVTVDSAGIVKAVAAQADALEAAIVEMEREEQELGNKLGLRDRALDAWSDHYQGGADALTGLFRLGGRKDLAERVRPTSRTLSGDEVAAGEEGAQTPAEGKPPEGASAAGAEKK